MTPQQSKVFALIRQGLTTKEIAQEMGLKLKTIEAHRSGILLSLKARNMPHAVSLWHRHHEYPQH